MLPFLLAVSAPSTFSILLKHVTVVDCSRRAPQPDMDVAISNGKIVAVARAPRLEATRAETTIDGLGKFLIPGLWDMHVHGTAIPGFAGIYLANGVTGVRDMFDPGEYTFKLRDAVKAGKLQGPRIVAAGKLVDGPTPIWPGSLTASNAQEGVKDVATLLSTGSDFVKVYSLLPRDAFFGIATECKRRGVVFAGHVPESVAASEASDAGMKSMEHLYGILRICSTQFTTPVSLFEDHAKSAKLQNAWLDSYSGQKAHTFFAKLKRNGTYQVPTFTVLYTMSHPTDPRADIQNRFDYMPSWLRASFNPGNNPRLRNWTRADFELQDRLFKKDLEIVSEMNRTGVPIMAGTDVMNPYCFPGFSLHDELGWLVKAGLTPWQALRSATLTPAEYLGLQKTLGTVQAGKDADCVLLDANPLDDIHNTTRISGVITRGKWLDQKALNVLMPKTSKTAPPTVAPAGFAGDGD